MANKKVFSLDIRTATPHFPGVGRYASELTAAMLPLLRSDERLLLVAPPGGYPSAEQVEVVSTDLSPFSLAQQIAIPRLLARTRVDLYHSTYYLMPYCPGVPTVLTAYDLIPLLLPSSVSMRARLFFRLTHRLAVGAASRVIAISEATRSDLLKRYRLSTEKITAIPLGVSCRFQPVDPRELMETASKYGLTGEYVLYVGINKPHKNLTRLLEAWKLVRQKVARPLTLVIAGPWDIRYDGPKRSARALGIAESVRFLGPISLTDLPGLYSGAKLFVFPSLYEGFGLPVLEAMACGTPVACSAIPSLEEVGGQAVSYFDPMNSAAAADRIAELLENQALREHRSMVGLRRAADYTWEETARRTLGLYRAVAPG